MEAIIKGLRSNKISESDKYLYKILVKEYGKKESKEMLGLLPSRIDLVMDSTKKKYNTLARAKFGPVSLSSTASAAKGMVKIFLPIP